MIAVVLGGEDDMMWRVTRESNTPGGSSPSEAVLFNIVNSDCAKQGVRFRCLYYSFDAL